MYFRTLGFAPDLPDETPGIMKECNGFIPTVKGMRAVPNPVVLETTLSGTAVGASTLITLDGTRTTYIGTDTQLFELTSTGYNDVSRASPAYSVPTGSYWSFDQYGNLSFAANKGDVLQQRLQGAPNWDDTTQTVSGAICEVVNDFVFLFNTGADHAPNDIPGLANDLDRWHCCALGDPTNWIPSIQTQCATGRLTDTYGKIEAAKRFGDDIVVYKERSMYIGRYIGPPFIWSWNVLSDEIGASGSNNVVSVGDPLPVHFFIGYDDIYIFDGSRPRSINFTTQGSIISEWFFNDLNLSFRDRITGVHDRQNQVIYFSYPSNTGGGVVDSYIAYNYFSKRWGAGRGTLQVAFEFFASGITYDQLGSIYNTYDDLPNQSYDTAFPANESPLIGFIGLDGQLYTLNGESDVNSYVTNDFGTDEQMTVISRVRPRFVTNPTSAIQEGRYRDSIGVNDEIVNVQSTLTDNAFDSVNEARWQSFRHEYTGNVEIKGIDITSRPAGSE